MTAKYVVSLGALHSEELADGRVVEPGQQVPNVDPEKDKRLIDEGVLIEAKAPKTTAADKSSQKKEEGSSDE